VAESVRDPLLYNGVNFGGTVPPCGVIAEFGVRRLPFSSSATVPGAPLDDMMAGVWCWQQRQGDEELRCHE
jgi:UDP-glucose 4-epimerase